MSLFIFVGYVILRVCLKLPVLDETAFLRIRVLSRWYLAIVPLQVHGVDGRVRRVLGDLASAVAVGVSLTVGLPL